MLIRVEPDPKHCFTRLVPNFLSPLLANFQDLSAGDCFFSFFTVTAFFHSLPRRFLFVIFLFFYVFKTNLFPIFQLKRQLIGCTKLLIKVKTI